MKVTEERLMNDFRETMREIVNVKNGRQKADGSNFGKNNTNPTQVFHS
jgi:hypothetical protein